MQYLYESWDNIKHVIDPYNIPYEFHLAPKNGKVLGIPDHYEINGVTNTYTHRCFEGKDQFVNYEVNSLLFRTPEFKKLNQNEVSVLYSGCSNTYGIGLPESFIWPSMLTKKLKEKHNNFSNSFNLGVSGSSVFLCIKNLMAFIRLYGKPTYIFIVVPPIARDVKYDKKQKRFYSVLRGGNYFEGDYPKVFLEYINNYYEDDILKAITQIKMFEDYCKEANIRLTWTYWYQNDSRIYKEFNFDSVLHLGEHKITENVLGLPYWELAQDGLHFGTCWHKEVSDKLYDRATND